MSLNATNLYLQASPIPATFKGTPNDLFTEMIKRMRILSPQGTNLIFVGDTEPTSNVGPWLKNGTQWYVWDTTTKRYIPQNISASYTAAGAVFWVGSALPTSSTPPIWLRTTLDPTTSDPLAYGDAIRWLIWNGTAWTWPHPCEPGGGIRQIWVGLESDLWLYDGGDGDDPANATDTTGAMWMADPTFNSRTLRGAVAGTLAPGALAGSDAATVVMPAYLPAHFHNESIHVRTGEAGLYHDYGNGTVSRVPPNIENATIAGPNNDVVTTTTDTAGTAVAPSITIPVIPASVGVYIIKRSPRKYYTP